MVYTYSPGLAVVTPDKINSRWAEEMGIIVTVTLPKKTVPESDTPATFGCKRKVFGPV